MSWSPLSPLSPSEYRSCLPSVGGAKLLNQSGIAWAPSSQQQLLPGMWQWGRGRAPGNCFSLAEAPVLEEPWCSWMSLELWGGCWRQYSSSMKGVCVKIYMLGSFGQNGIDSLLFGFACLVFLWVFFWWFFWFYFGFCFVLIFCILLLLLLLTFGVFFTPKTNIWIPQAHWKKGWKFNEQLPGHIYVFPSSLFLFLSSYSEIHFSMIWAVPLAWAPEYCGGKDHKSREWHSCDMCAVIRDWFCVNHLSSTGYRTVEHLDHNLSSLLAEI